MPRVPDPKCGRCGAERIIQKGRYRCRACLNRTQAERRALLSDEVRERERIRDNAGRNARHAEWTHERRAQVNAKVQAWRETHREQHRRVTREWYAAHAEETRTKKIATYHADPEPFLARNQLRKARRLAAVCDHGSACVTPEFLTALYAAACVYCGAPAAEADHFYPLSRGGLHCVENLVPACFECNRSKHAADPHDWIALRS